MKTKFKIIFCAVFRHSRITDSFWGYHHCARCDEQLGDSLGGIYEAFTNLGCGCQTCQDNYAKAGFLDRFLTPKPRWLGFSPDDWRVKVALERQEGMDAMRRAIAEREELNRQRTIQ